MSQSNPVVKRRFRLFRMRYLCVFIIAIVLFISFVIPTIKVFKADHYTSEVEATSSVALENGRVFKQELQNIPLKKLNEISIRFGTYGRVNRGTLEVKLFEDDREVYSWTVPSDQIVDNELHSFMLDTPVLMHKNSVYSFTIVDSYRGRNVLSVMLNRWTGTGYWVDDIENERGTLCYTMRYNYPIPSTGVTTAIAFALMAAVLLLAFSIHAYWDILSARVNGVSQRLPRIRLRNTEVTVWDWLVFAVLAIFCYFTMSHGDILHTGPSSFALLRGHVLDFYEYNAQYFGGNAYMISTYLMFALWNIPLAILGLMGPPSMKQSYAMLMWLKALPTTLFVLSGIMVYKICKKIEKQAGVNAKWGTFLFLLTSTAFYSQFMFGQYDVMTVFFMVWGIKVLFDDKKNSLIWFSVLFGFATTFKYHAMLFFFPILLYKEKRLPALIKDVACFGMVIILINLPYLHSTRFTSGVQEFGAVDYFFAANLEYYVGGEEWRFYLVPLAWIVICVIAYVRKTEKEPFDQFRAIAFFANLVVWLAFGVVFWHPQWPMIATPFLVFSFFASKRRDVLCLLDIGLTIAFMSFLETVFMGLTQNFYSLGFFGDQVAGRQVLSAISFDQFCLLKDRNVAFTTFSGVLLARALLIRPEWNLAERISTPQQEALWFRIRSYVGVALLVIPMILCLFSELHTPTYAAKTQVDEEHGKVTIEIDTEFDPNSFFAAVWSQENEQDDLVWYSMEKIDEKTWRCEVPLEDHNTLGTYYVHFYYIEDGKSKLIDKMGFEVNSLPDFSSNSLPQAS